VLSRCAVRYRHYHRRNPTPYTYISAESIQVTVPFDIPTSFTQYSKFLEVDKIPKPWLLVSS
jgi:hypothetical protein